MTHTRAPAHSAVGGKSEGSTMKTITKMTLCAYAGTLAMAAALPAMAQEAAPQTAQETSSDDTRC